MQDAINNVRRIFSVEFCRFQRSRTQQRTPEVPRTASVPLSRWMREEKMIVDYECHVYVFPANCRYASLELYNALNGTHLPLHWNLIKIANMSSGYMSRFVAQTCPLWQWSLSNMPLVSLTRCSQEIEVVQHFGSFSVIAHWLHRTTRSDLTGECISSNIEQSWLGQQNSFYHVTSCNPGIEITGIYKSHQKSLELLLIFQDVYQYYGVNILVWYVILICYVVLLYYITLHFITLSYITLYYVILRYNHIHMYAAMLYHTMLDTTKIGP